MRIVGVILGLAAIAVPAQPRSAAKRMDDPPVTALREMMNAVNAGDPEEYARLYAPDAVIEIHGTRVFTGRSAIEDYERELLREFPGVRLAFHAIWRKGLLAVVHYAVNGQTAGGQRMGHEGLLFYRFQQSGLIQDERRYLDSLTPMAQLAARGAAPFRPPPPLPDAVAVRMAKGSPMEDWNVALVRASVAALDSKNEMAFLSNLADDIVLDEMIDPRPVTGKGDAKAWFRKWTAALPDAKTEITRILGIEEFVLVEMVVRGTPKGRPVHRAAIVQVKAGKFTRIANFMNGRELAAAVGR
ncbi:MAG: nuclear transport factor 2 family protein [Bryobacteraceae bacterium]